MIIKIIVATIYGNVYGGANTSKVYGDTEEQDYYWFTEDGLMDLMSLEDIKEVKRVITDN